MGSPKNKTENKTEKMTNYIFIARTLAIWKFSTRSGWSGADEAWRSIMMLGPYSQIIHSFYGRIISYNVVEVLISHRLHQHTVILKPI